MVSIIVPVYNESESIVTVLNDILELKGNFEVIVVDDYSTDGSRSILESMKGIKLISHLKNKGYSNSLKTGIKAAKGEWIIIIDSDETYPVKAIPELLKYIDKYDMVIGARMGSNVNIPILRKPAKWFLSKLGNYIASQKIPDLNSGLRVFRKSLALKFWKLLPERFSFTITMTLAALTNGYDVKYIPIDYYKRKGKSTIHPINDFVGFIKLLFKMSLFFKPLKIFIPFSIFIFLMGIIIAIVGLLIFDKLLDVTFVMITLSAVQIFIFGLIAEIIVRK